MEDEFDEFQETFQRMCDTAMKLWVEDGHLAPVVAVVTETPLPEASAGETGFLTMLDTTSPEAKSASYRAIAAMAKPYHPIFYVLVTEAWLNKPLTKDVEGYPAPSQDPNRMDCVVVIARHRDGRFMMRVWENTGTELKEDSFEQGVSGQDDKRTTGPLDQLFWEEDPIPFSIGKDGKMHQDE